MSETATQTFPTTEAAWLHACAVFDASPACSMADAPAPCQIIDASLDRLFQLHRIELRHMAILKLWGEKGCAPTPHDRVDYAIWREAIEALDWPLRVKGVVA